MTSGSKGTYRAFVRSVTLTDCMLGQSFGVNDSVLAPMAHLVHFHTNDLALVPVHLHSACIGTSQYS